MPCPRCRDTGGGAGPPRRPNTGRTIGKGKGRCTGPRAPSSELRAPSSAPRHPPARAWTPGGPSVPQLRSRAAADADRSRGAAGGGLAPEMKKRRTQIWELEIVPRPWVLVCALRRREGGRVKQASGWSALVGAKRGPAEGPRERTGVAWFARGQQNACSYMMRGGRTTTCGSRGNVPMIQLQMPMSQQ